MPSGDNAPIFFNAAIAAARFFSDEWFDRISHTNSVNGSIGGAGSLP